VEPGALPDLEWLWADVGFLHFTVDWEHRFAPGLPADVYDTLRRGFTKAIITKPKAPTSFGLSQTPSLQPAAKILSEHHGFVTLKFPLRPLVAVHVPLIVVPDERAVSVTIVPVQSEPRPVNWPDATPHSPDMAQ
jgi:hypothetical protein